jgi:glutathione-specific gamma-glutamylcyclotransferase
MLLHNTGIPAGPEPCLTAELCASLDATVVDPGPAAGLSYLTDAEYEASIAAVLADASNPDEIWIFAYGSLIWNPGFTYDDKRRAALSGWHRSFCLKSMRWRGMPDRPGLIMALEPGGACEGLAYRLSRERLHSDLQVLWRRELGVKPVNHLPRWVGVETGNGPVRAITFVANPEGQSYLRVPSLELAAEMIAGAVGVWGPCATYLYQTVEHLRALGIHDPYLWRLQALVADRIRAGAGREKSVQPAELVMQPCEH